MSTWYLKSKEDSTRRVRSQGRPVWEGRCDLLGDSGTQGKAANASNDQKHPRASGTLHALALTVTQKEKPKPVQLRVVIS